MSWEPFSSLCSLLGSVYHWVHTSSWFWVGGWDTVPCSSGWPQTYWRYSWGCPWTLGPLPSPPKYWGHGLCTTFPWQPWVFEMMTYYNPAGLNLTITLLHTVGLQVIATTHSPLPHLFRIYKFTSVPGASNLNNRRIYFECWCLVFCFLKTWPGLFSKSNVCDGLWRPCWELVLRTLKGAVFKDGWYELSLFGLCPMQINCNWQI